VTRSTLHPQGSIKTLMASRSPLSARSDRGFALIEVIVSAAVLAMMALAVLSGIDGATQSTGRERARSVAAALAEQDQERLRSIAVEQLATYAPTDTPITVGAATYTVSSRVEAVHDSTGGIRSCANDTTEADYLHITSTVTSNVVGTRTLPVKIDSIVAPDVAYSTTHGTLAVKVVNAAGVPLPGLAVALSGASSQLPQDTNAQGCALFPGIPIGDYTATLNNLSMVDKDGKAPATTAATVSAGKRTTVTMVYDLAATVNATIETYKPGTNSGPITSYAARISAVNGIDVLRNFPEAGPASPALSAYAATNLFPFTSSYSFFTGTCLYSDPTFDSGNTGYYNTYPGAVLAAGGSTTSVVIRQPPLNVRLIKDKGSNSPPGNGMLVVATPVKPNGQSCVEPSISLKTFTPSAGLGGSVGRSLTGTTLEAGLPFGYYNLCFQRGTGSSAYSTDYPADLAPAGTAPYDNTDAFGQASTKLLDAKLDSLWSNQPCAVTT
jgi:prepilin-type N-terminal cleavage/methylation domain-containing protein